MQITSPRGRTREPEVDVVGELGEQISDEWPRNSTVSLDRISGRLRERREELPRAFDRRLVSRRGQARESQRVLFDLLRECVAVPERADPDERQRGQDGKQYE